MKTVGVIGLGNMGRGMALSLKRGGYDVLGFDATPGIAEALQAEGVVACASIAEITRNADVLILSLPTSDIVEKVVLGEGGVAANARPGLIVVDTTTAEPASTRKVAAALAEVKVGLVDGPVSGGPKGAATATMTMVLGGSDADVAAVEPVLAVMSAKRVHVGPVGAGHVTKIINNMLTGVHLLATSEAVRAAEAAGVNPEKLVEALNGGSGRNSATLTNYPTWIFNGKFDSGFTMKLMRKDVRLAMDMLRKLSVTAPIAIEAGRLWAASVESIGDQEDFNRIVEFTEKN
ncbi:MAG: NAD(P)-dependent oxidoreductase [Burkholderia contaminans]|uniref:NAD(P)-dependent oxidoreductase n=2 Tax=Bacteria TaxID=2 RepID=A0AAP4R6Y1_9BURK|nr:MULTISPECIES: NAD(P)-dependent oxidoreductase [Burkholderia]MBD1414159.1 NAD(P)-dependent oxidoreductase [Burkholderia contaminans]MBH9670911.1 NAD(P)-dependent oxidoreductase [Burkholderia contaminans]MBH9677657.1 NAD(P)-dependent oxidoreductase [Burkholderia contaminans]MBH9708081.1 NAD(P)-dependent oxidoreductase [Burkholderia contaminans]MBH9722456.1 NAD(P)-dependent oxidoreductase [Burkholderia contaminans]